MKLWTVPLAAILLATAAPVAAQTSQAPAADQAATTPGGAAYTAPKGWRREGNLLLPPEIDTRVALIDGIVAPDAAAAAAAAWTKYRPEMRRPVRIATPRPPRQGWDARTSISYETSPNEKLVVEAYSHGKGGTWTVLLLEGSEATIDKRGAAINQMLQSLKAPGYAPESFLDRTAHTLDATRIAALRTFLRDGMDKLGVPGVAFALIEDGKVIVEEGIGVKRLGSPDPVDKHSRFMVASNTKGMSTLMLATLVDEGKLAWDAPVTSIYPAFRLGDAKTTASVRIRHLVCACTGLPRKDFEWIFNTPRDTDPAQVFPLLAATQPTSGFGEVFQYNNLITTAGGFIGGQVAHPGGRVGEGYDRAMRERIFGPLGMTDTTFSFAEAIAGNHASPHGMDPDGKVAVSSHDLAYSIAPYRPAGGAWSSVHDMARYAALELSKGVLPDGKRLVSEANLLERRKRGVSVGENCWYGMGLQENADWGTSVIHHGGAMPGYMTNFFVIPQAKVAAVLLTNSDSGNALLSPFQRRLLELLFDGKPEAAENVASSAAAMKASRAVERAKLAIPPAPAAVSALASRYTSPELGTITVATSATGTVFAFTDWQSAVATRRNDDGTTSFVTIDPSIDGIPFVVGAKDGKRTLTVRDSQHDYVFTEAAGRP